MKRLLFVVAAILLSPLCAWAQGTWPTLNVDLAVPMNTSTPGTTLTAAIANAGTDSSFCVVGTSCFWSGTGGGAIPAGYTVGAWQDACSNLGPVQLSSGGTLYPTQQMNYNNYAHSDTSSNIAQLNLSGVASTFNHTVTTCITVGVPQQSNGNDWDLIMTQDSSGQYAVLQLNQACTGGGGGSAYGVRIENHAVQHSPCIQLIPQQTYFVSMNWDHTNAMSCIWVWTATGGFVGNSCLANAGGGSGDKITDVRIVSNENGTDSNTTYFQNTLMQFSAVSPTGTGTFTNGLATVTGTGFVTGNVWNNAVLNVGGTLYTIAAVQSSTQLTLATTFSGSSGSAGYVVELPLFWTQTDPWTGVLAPARGADWTGNAGVTGGIPTTRTQCVTTACNTVTSAGTAVTAAQIQAAWASAPSGTYVLLPSGTLSSAAPLTLSGVSNATLRGAGANNTTIPGQITLGSSGGAGGNLTTVSGNTLPGSNVVTLASVANLTVGAMVVFDQLGNGQSGSTDVGGILVIGTGSSYTGSGTSPGIAGPYSQDGETNGIRATGSCSSTNPVGCYWQQQSVIVTSCNGTTTPGASCAGSSVVVGFNPPLAMPNWSTASSMSAWWPSAPPQFDGIEDLTVDCTSVSSINCVEMQNTANSWVKGATVFNSNQSHIDLQFTTRDTIENSYFFLTQNHTTGSYGVQCTSASGFLIENNIFHGIASPVIWNGTCNDGVVGYNFSINQFYTSGSAGYNQNFHGAHATGDDTILFEGNIANWISGDNVHGTANLNTFERNLLSGPFPACWDSSSNTTNSQTYYSSASYGTCSNALNAVQLLSFHRFYNFVGNVWGTTGVNTTLYGTTANNAWVVGIGYGNGGPPSDPNTQSTAVFWANADSASGFTSPQYNCSNVMGGTAFQSIPLPQFFATNPCPAVHTIPPSFYYTSKPSWFPSSKPWPLIGPDVTSGNVLTCTSGTYNRGWATNSSQCAGGTSAPLDSGLVNSNPAMDCYLLLGGVPNGTGPQLTNFNENTCYATSGTVSLTPSSNNFGSVTVGSSSSTATFTLTNTTASTVTGITFSNVGGNTADFPTVSGGTCTTSLAASSSCTYLAKFSPSIVGAESTTLTVNDSFGTQTSALSGTGLTAGTVTVTPSSQNFGSIAVGSSSGNFTFTITSTLSTSTSLAISNVGGNTADFPNTGTGTCTSTLAASSSCTYIAKFSPSIIGAESTTLTVVDSAGTQTSALSGTGTSAGAITLTPTSNNFGTYYNLTTSPAQSFTLSNSSGVTITSITITKVGGNTADFTGVAAGASPCGTSLATGLTCTVNSSFTPQAAGARSTTLTVSYTGGSVTSALSGTGVTPPTPPTPVFNYSADDYGGLTTVSCSGHPHSISIITASQSGTVQTVHVSSVANFGVNEAMLISGTSTAMDWTFIANNPTDGASYITAINSGTNTLTLTAAASHTVGTVSIGTIRPGRMYIQSVATPYGTGPQFCTPENHWIWLTAVGAAGGQAYQGSGAATINYSYKYGGYCNAAQALQAEFVNTLNFNTIGPDADPTYSLNSSCTSNTRVTTFSDNNLSTYSAANLGGYISQPLMDLNVAVDNFYNPTNGGNAPIVDYFNPNWESFISNFITKFNGNLIAFYRTPHFMGTPGDDTDFTKLPDAGGDFHTIPITHQSVDPALQVMVTSPLLTLEAVPTADIYAAGQPTPYVLSNPLNYSKTPMASPPATCSITGLCDLFDFVSKKYGTIGALNTAWSTSGTYSTFGTSGTCYGWSFTPSWCAATGAAASFAGTGVTTYTPTLNTVTAPHSVQILLNGVPIGGDCPFFSSVGTSGCTGSAGTGNLKGPGVWKASLAFPTGFTRTDSNGNIEVATVGGTSGIPTPSWPATCTGTQTTTDGTGTWECLGPGIAAASTITYATGATSIVFNSALSSSYTVTIKYIANGWGTGTGWMDEDGRHTGWIGTNYICLIQPPPFATLTTYAVNQKIHDATSGTWQVVTVPGTSGSSTPTFSATQGTPTSSGTVTFLSMGLPVCGTEAGSDWGAINANQTFAADMENWLVQESGAYFSGIQTAFHTNYPDLLYGGADAVGVWGAPPRAGVLIAAQQYSDWIYTATFSAPNIDLNAYAKNSFQTQYYTRPMATYHTLISTQSFYGCGAGTTPTLDPTVCFTTQAAKGNQYFLNTQAQLNTLSYSGTQQWAGMQWWGSGPFQSSDFGFKSSLENAYDGSENVVAPVSCSPPLGSYPAGPVGPGILSCGGETTGSSWIGVSLTSSIASANLLWTQNTSAGTLTFTPTSLNFGSLALYIPSSVLQVQVTNTGSVLVTVTGVTFSGAPYAFQTSSISPDCRGVSSIAVGASCYLAVNVTPAIAGVVAGSIVMTDSATGSPHTIPLTLTGLSVPGAPNPIFGDLP